MARSAKVQWTDQSIVARRGVGWARQPILHELTEALQGKFHYTIGPYSDPVLTVAPGDRIRIETRDAFEGAIRTESDKPTERLRMPFVNPQNGPIMIDGAEPGDALAVHIESMLPRGENPCGTCCMIPYFGALTGTTLTATLNPPLPELTRKIHVDEQHVRWSTRVTLPYSPHIGTLSTSPEIDSINSLTPDSHGGNMDLPDMGPGSITYLPVRTAGARLFIGDAHACQGDGEVCGTAVEYPSTTTIRVDVIKGWTLDWPRLEREDFIMTIGSARPLEDATRIAYRELVLWMEAEYGFDRWDAYMMLSQCGRVRLGNFVDPKYTVGAGDREDVFGITISQEDSPMDLGLAGMKALVTGGTKGIGRAVAEHFAAEGADVAICARDGAGVTEAVAALAARGVRATGRALDVADGPALIGWVQDAARELGGLDIVVSNVSALAIGQDEASWQAEFSTDMMGTVRAVNAAMPFLEQSKAGSIVVISSVSGREVDFAAGPYGVFKAALVHYAKGLSYQLAGRNIRVNAVSPGNTYFPGGVWEKIEQGNPALFNQAMALNPTGRMGRPEEMARAVVFLASPAASFITGTNLVVDGALTRGVQF